MPTRGTNEGRERVNLSDFGRRPIHGFLVGAFLIGLESAAAGSVLTTPTVNSGSFNPTLGEPSRLQFEAAHRGDVRPTILDRDGFVIRRLPFVKSAVGKNTVIWDGKDDAGLVVPDDVYTFRLEFNDGKVSENYDPAKGFVPAMQHGKATYS